MVMRKVLFGAVGLAALAWAGQAGAFVSVIGGGLAHACSEAAMNGAADVQSERLCTEALENEIMDLRDRAGTYVNRGILKLRRMQYDSANFDFNRAVQLKPDLGEAYVNRGAAQVGQRRYQEGLDDLNKAIELGVDEPEKAYYNRAIAYEGLNDLKAAYFDYQKAVELKPEWEPPRRELARFKVSRQ
jgi:tetratricopeptide (TPR) repeat protein